MGPRLDGRGDGVIQDGVGRVLVLQWGRGSMAAETHVPAPVQRAPIVLQWGRGSMAAET